MATIDRNTLPTDADVDLFLESINFKLPKGFIDFYKGSNRADLSSNDAYVILWPLTKLLQLNKDYNVALYAPEFFIFGSDGGDTAYAIEKVTGFIFEMPFIGMSMEEAIFKTESFTEFIETI